MTSRTPVDRSIPSVTDVLQDLLENVEWSLQQSKQLKREAVSSFDIISFRYKLCLKKIPDVFLL